MATAQKWGRSAGLIPRVIMKDKSGIVRRKKCKVSKMRKTSHGLNFVIFCNFLKNCVGWIKSVGGPDLARGP